MTLVVAPKFGQVVSSGVDVDAGLPIVSPGIVQLRFVHLSADVHGVSSSLCRGVLCCPSPYTMLPCVSNHACHAPHRRSSAPRREASPASAEADTMRVSLCRDVSTEAGGEWCCWLRLAKARALTMCHECVVRHGCALVVKTRRELIMERVTCARWSRSGRASVGVYATCVYSMR